MRLLVRIRTVLVGIYNVPVDIEIRTGTVYRFTSPVLPPFPEAEPRYQCRSKFTYWKKKKSARESCETRQFFIELRCSS